jgi:hypothetical protein
MAEVGLLAFGRTAFDVARAVLPSFRTRFSKHQFTQPQLLAILCLMRYEDWTFREAEVRLREHQELRQTLGLKSVPDFTTLYRLSQAAGRPEPRPGGRRDGAADAWGATMRPSASSGGPRCHRLGPGSGQHVLCATPAPSRAKSPALAALAEVDGRGGSGSADSPLAARAAVHGTTVGLCPPGWKRLPTRRASGWCWPMPNSTARGITLISAGSSGPGM